MRIECAEFIMAKQITLFQCHSRVTANNQENTQVRSETTSSSSRSSSSESSSTIVIAEESCSISLCSDDLDKDCVKSVQHGVNKNMGVVQNDAGMNGSDCDVIDAQPELVITTTRVTRFSNRYCCRTRSNPVQLKMKFPVSLKGNKQCSFQSEWYRLYCYQIKPSAAKDEISS